MVVAGVGCYARAGSVDIGEEGEVSAFDGDVCPVWIEGFEGRDERCERGMRAADDVDLGAGGVFCEGEQSGTTDASGGADEDGGRTGASRFQGGVGVEDVGVGHHVVGKAAAAAGNRRYRLLV